MMLHEEFEKLVKEQNDLLTEYEKLRKQRLLTQTPKLIILRKLNKIRLRVAEALKEYQEEQ